MKKILGLIGAGIIFFSGCASKNEINHQQICQIDGTSAPSWICNGGEVKGMITGIGSAKPSPLGFSFQRTEAIAAARDNIAREISIKVKNVFKRFEESSGVGKNTLNERVIQNVSKQLSYETLRNSKLLKLWKSPNGTIYVLVGMPKEEIVNNFKTEIKANKAWKNLDKEIDKEFNY